MAGPAVSLTLEELVALLIAYWGRAAVQQLLHEAVNRALGGGRPSPTGCARWPDQFDADELGLDPEEDDRCPD